MGEFSQSLLKLTEFPFSYSLIGLLGLIFGQGANVEELSFESMGPLLFLIVFVATTLSICDPVGALQKLIIKGRNVGWSKDFLFKPFSPKEDYSQQELRPRIGEPLRTAWLTYRVIERTICQIKDKAKLAFRWKNKYERHQPWGGIFEVFTYQKIFGEYMSQHFDQPFLFALVYSPEELKERYGDWGSTLDSIYNRIPTIDVIKLGIQGSKEFEKTMDDIFSIGYYLRTLKQNAVKTKWITAEIDRITALVYFMIIISLFIVTILVSPQFLQNFTQVFTDVDSSKIVILIFSIIALIAVSYMFNLRIRGLRKKAGTAFHYLATLEAIKTAHDRFKENLKDVERYLNDNDWTLAEYWTNRIKQEYTYLFMDELQRTEKA